MTYQSPDPAEGMGRLDNPLSRPIETGRATGPVTGTGGGAGWGRQTHPTGARSGGDLPDLRRYSATPRYDLATLAQFVSMRPVTLWSWEQNLGIPPTENAAGATGLRYTERDLIAIIWLRDQIVAGAPPNQAAQRLREAYVAAQMDASSPHASGPPSVPIMRPASGAPPQHTSRPMSGPIARARPLTTPINTGASASNQPWGNVSAYDLRALCGPLINSLQTLDTQTATRMLDEAMLTRPAEAICQQLIAPVLTVLLAKVSKREVTQPELLFAINLFQNRLGGIFERTVESRESPLVIVACGPDETHTVDALMLAVHLRRAGMRVVYLGQVRNHVTIVEMARRHKARVVALALTGSGHLRQVRKLANELERQDSRIALALVGPALQANPELRKRAGGVFAGVTATEATEQVRGLLRPMPAANG